MKLIVSIYRSAKKEGMYLYVPKGSDLAKLPESLLQHFGKCEHAMTLLLTPEKKLARAEVGKVIKAIEEAGYYLQLPPVADVSMQHIPNDKLSVRPI